MRRFDFKPFFETTKTAAQTNTDYTCTSFQRVPLVLLTTSDEENVDDNVKTITPYRQQVIGGCFLLDFWSQQGYEIPGPRVWVT